MKATAEQILHALNHFHKTRFEASIADEILCWGIWFDETLGDMIITGDARFGDEWAQFSLTHTWVDAAGVDIASLEPEGGSFAEAGMRRELEGDPNALGGKL